MSEIKRLTAPCAGTYLVHRTSIYGDAQPCDEAYQVEVMTVEVRSVDDPKKIPAHKGTDGGWYDKGSNHRITDGKICRDLGWHREWAVDVNDILEFADRHGDCVVSRRRDGFGVIEIYDDYRE